MSDPEAATATTARTGRLVAGAAMVAGALCLAGTAFVHLHLHDHGYGSIPTIGPLFMLQAIVGLALAVLVACWHRWFVAAAGALFLLATAGGLLYSVWFGLFGFSDSLGAPYAGMSLVLEFAGAVVLTAAAVALALLDRRAGSLWRLRVRREPATRAGGAPAT
jgi:hypothetical protein